MQALVFYRMWREENKQNGKANHGHAGEMKEEAARFIIQELDPGAAHLEIDAVVTLMNRPKSRRND